ncbi:MAG TPA: hypothetical protein VGI06_04460, partial [Acidimicrobiales bacterium]
RYEELHADPVTTLKSVLDRLALDPSAYDFDALRALPVRGSSQTAAEGWTPVAAGPDFDPLGRGTNLGAAMGRRLEWLLASEMRELGYGSLPAPPHVLARTRQRLLDARWAVAHVFSRTTRAVGAGGAEFRRDRTRVIDGRRAAAGPEQLAAEAPSAG